ncbi:MAG: hypothetical protein V1872_03935 [bacterium]
MILLDIEVTTGKHGIKELDNFQSPQLVELGEIIQLMNLGIEDKKRIPLSLKSYHCEGKVKEFTRKDVYNDKI